MSRIFISYRRQDSADVTGRMFDHLSRHYSRDDLFKDVDSIGLGLDFRKVIATAVESCDVVLVVIGPHWVDATDPEGRLRLHDPDDFVRIEVETGLERDIVVIPVLVGGATMPERGRLPKSLQPLVYRNAIALRPDPDFSSDMQRLVRALEAIIASPPTDTDTDRPASHEPAADTKESGKRFKTFLMVLFVTLTLIAIGYLFFKAQPVPDPRADISDPCATANPPASCLFQ